MSQLAALTAAEINAWLTRVAQTIDRSLREPARSEIGASLRGTLDVTVGIPVLAQLALLDDCLRVANLAASADGQIDTQELTVLTDLVRVAAEKYFAALPAYVEFSDGIGAVPDTSRFLSTHATDAGPFGGANPAAWRGLHLVRDVERLSRNGDPLRDHERMLARVMDVVFGDRESEIERRARKNLRQLFEPAPSAGLDPRVVAFCSGDGPEVFDSVEHGSQFYERDPFDAESIHGEARDTFHRLVERATTPALTAAGGHGRTLLLLGESGCGKTHLLRALRTQVHSQRRGYVGYLQMTPDISDVPRYVLRALIDSLEKPYDAPVLAETSLMYLSDGLVEGAAAIPQNEVERLRTGELSAEELARTVGTIVDRIVRTDGMHGLESDLIHALLLLQRRDPAVQRRVVKYLRCEELTDYDRSVLGGLAAREDPLRTIQQLAAIMRELQLATLVIVVDQIEDVSPDRQLVHRLQEAFNALRSIADGIPSVVLVLSCLSDLYDLTRAHLSAPLIDRLEHDPPVRLSNQRERDEIELMLVRRLEYLYQAFDVPWREDDPLFPFVPAQIDAVVKFRARDCLARFRAYHAACVAAGKLVSHTSLPAPVTAAPPPPPPSSTIEVDKVWADAIEESRRNIPDEDTDLRTLITEAVRGVASELGVSIHARTEGERVIIDGNGQQRVLEICNGGAQGGALGRQVAALGKVGKRGAMPIALRTTDWSFKPTTVIAKTLGEFRAGGGRTVVLTDGDLSVVGAARRLRAHPPAGYDAWCKQRRPLSELGLVREILELDRLAVVPISVVMPPLPSVPPPAPKPPKSAPPADPIADAQRVKLGSTISVRQDVISLPLAKINTHVAFLGGTGSGKTTAALSVVEQLLERDVSVLLVDRKGDLACYANEGWWSDPDGMDPARRRALRERIDVALYTPGNLQGRALRLPLVTPLADATPQERGRLASFAAAGLAAMLNYGRSGRDNAKMSVLQCAIEVLADYDVTVENLINTIDKPDPELLNRTGNLQRHFASVSEDLQSLRIQRGALLSSDGETFDIETMLPPIGSRPRLTIINTTGLGDVNVQNFWVSRLLVEIARLCRKRPTPTLQAAVFFDEADAYVPATSAPPTKAPMFDLLKRARSAGVGVLLATQNPGDFDYRARDNIGTWLVGRIRENLAVQKMGSLLGDYPGVAGRLASQPTGHFFVLDGKSVEIKCDRSLMQTAQLSEAAVAELAAASRPPA